MSPDARQDRTPWPPKIDRLLLATPAVMVLGGVTLLIIGSGGGTRDGIIFLILAAVDLALVVPMIRKHRGSSAGHKAP
jgi:hypothetical protein